jgi:hypothetical protein
MRAATKRSQRGSAPTPSPELARRLRQIDEAANNGDYEALLEMAERSIAEMTHTVQGLIADQRRSLQAMIKTERRIDRNQAATARALDRLIGGH